MRIEKFELSTGSVPVNNTSIMKPCYDQLEMFFCNNDSS